MADTVGVLPPYYEPVDGDILGECGSKVGACLDEMLPAWWRCLPLTVHMQPETRLVDPLCFIFSSRSILRTIKATATRTIEDVHQSNRLAEPAAILICVNLTPES